MKNTHTVTKLPDPLEDGITHINVHYNAGLTELGRHLSTYYVAKFEHPYFGPFKCVEGFMLYIQTGCADDTFRSLTGGQAKSHFHKSLGAGKLVEHQIKNEEAILTSALHAKLEYNPVIAAAFIASTLPFEHYYRFAGSKVPIRPKEGVVLTNSLTNLRTLMRAGNAPNPLSDAEYASLIVR